MIFPNKQAKRDKLLLRLDREYRRLCRVVADAPLVALERPFQRGWIKSFRLREDILRRQDAHVFRRILSVINDRAYCRNRDFVDRSGNRVVIHPKIILFKEWPTLQWPENHKRHFLLGHWSHRRKWHSQERDSYLYGYKLACEWMLQEQIEPFLVTHVRTELPAVRKRMSEIQRHFTQRLGRERLWRIYGYRHNCWNRLIWSAAELRAEEGEWEAEKEWREFQPHANTAH